MAKEDNLFEEKAEGTKPAVNADKLKALRAAMEKIEKNYGKGSIMKLGDESIENIEGTGNSRTADPLVGSRHHRDRLCGSSDSESGIGRRHGRQQNGLAGPSDVAGTA